MDIKKPLHLEGYERFISSERKNPNSSVFIADIVACVA